MAVYVSCLFVLVILFALLPKDNMIGKVGQGSGGGVGIGTGTGEGDGSGGQEFSQFYGDVGIGWTAAGAGAAKYTDAVHFYILSGPVSGLADCFRPARICDTYRL